MAQQKLKAKKAQSRKVIYRFSTWIATFGQSLNHLKIEPFNRSQRVISEGGAANFVYK